MLRSRLWGYLLASVCGGLVVAAVLIVFGAPGTSDTRTVEIEPAYGSSSSANSRGPVTLNYLYRRDGPGVVGVRGQDSAAMSGSGFLVAGSGYMLTSYAAVAPQVNAARPITVQFDNGIVRVATLVRYDSGTGIALLKTSMQGIASVAQPLPLGDSGGVSAGDPAITLANPFGTDRTIASGVISSLQRQLLTPAGAAIADVFQTDLPVSRQTRGGPLLDENGNVVGVMALIDGVPFAVPINTVKQDVLTAIPSH